MKQAIYSKLDNLFTKPPTLFVLTSSPLLLLVSAESACSPTSLSTKPHPPLTYPAYAPAIPHPPTLYQLLRPTLALPSLCSTPPQLSLRLSTQLCTLNLQANTVPSSLPASLTMSINSHVYPSIPSLQFTQMCMSENSQRTFLSVSV